MLDTIENKKLWIKWLQDTHNDETYLKLLNLPDYEIMPWQEKLSELYADYPIKKHGEQFIYSYSYNPYLYLYAILKYFETHPKYNISALDLYLLLKKDYEQYYLEVLKSYYEMFEPEYLAKMNQDISRDTYNNFLKGYKFGLSQFKENK